MMKGKSKEEKAEAGLHIVRYAQRHGNKQEARQFGCSKNTVKLLRRRFEAEGMSGLNDKRDVPGDLPHKTPEAMEQYMVDWGRKVPCTRRSDKKDP